MELNVSRDTAPSTTGLNAEQWLRLVLDRQPRIAVFDCDGTLWGKDAGFSFMEWSLERGLVSRQGSDWLATRYREYLAGAVDEATICGEMVQVYAGLREQELRQAARRFFAEVVEQTIFAPMLALVHALVAAGTEVWAVSSTADWVIEAGVAERFGIPATRVLAARVRVLEGLATSELLSVPTDEAKAVALREAGVPHPDAVFGNSIHDLAMLEIGRHAYPVNPSSELLVRAQAAGWPVFRP